MFLFIHVVSSNNMILRRLSHCLDLFWLLQYLYPRALLRGAVPWAAQYRPNDVKIGHASGARQSTWKWCRSSVYDVGGTGPSTWTALACHLSGSHDLCRCYTSDVWQSFSCCILFTCLGKKSVCAWSKWGCVRRWLLLSFLLTGVY